MRTVLRVLLIFKFKNNSDYAQKQYYFASPFRLVFQPMHLKASPAFLIH